MSLESMTAPRAPRTTSVSFPARVLLATLSAAAGAIHLAMAPSHAGESALEGAGFFAAGWLQLTLAAVLLVRPSRRALAATVLSNLALIGLWAMSRTVGLPFGARPWHAESVSFVDVTGVVIEAALVFAAHAITLRPDLGRDWNRSRLALGAVVPIVVVALTTATLASPGARDHAAHSHDEQAAAHEHDSGHEHDGAPAGTSTATVDDRGLTALLGGHEHEPEVALDPATRATLSVQLQLTRLIMDAYPTIAAAEAAGYTRSGPFAPGLGAHYDNAGSGAANPDGVMDAEDIMKPTLIYDGLAPTAPLAGFMYISTSPSTPEGFVGPNDHWHYHTNLCALFHNGVLQAPFGADGESTERLCRAYGGTYYKRTAYMVHVWTVPGYASRLGVFSNVNPAITCPDGTYHMRNIDTIGFAPSACLNA